MVVRIKNKNKEFQSSTEINLASVYYMKITQTIINDHAVCRQNQINW